MYQAYHHYFPLSEGSIVTFEKIGANVVRARADVVATKLGIILSFFLLFLSFHILFSQKGFTYDFEFFWGGIFFGGGPLPHFFFAPIF